MYGVHYKTYGTYVGTGAGLTLSAFNFNKLVESLEKDGCSKNPTHNDDVEISNCLKTVRFSEWFIDFLIKKIKKSIIQVGIHVADSRDTEGRFRFFPLNPQGTLNKKNRPDWLYTWLQYEMPDVCALCFVFFKLHSTMWRACILADAGLLRWRFYWLSLCESGRNASARISYLCRASLQLKNC